MRPGRKTFLRLFGDFGAQGCADSCIWGLQLQPLDQNHPLQKALASFFFEFALGLALNNGGDFGEFSVVSISPGTEARKFRRTFSLPMQAARYLEGPTRKPRHASVFSTHSDTQAAPAFHCTRMFKGIFFDTRVFKTHRNAVYHCLKEVQKRFHAGVLETRVSTRACPFLKRAFSPI